MLRQLCKMGTLLCFLFTPFCVQAHSAIHFAGACQRGPHLLVAAVGDVILHQALQEKTAKLGFKSLWASILPYLQRADMAYANLEGPLAHGVSKHGKIVEDPGHKWDDYVYSSYPRFNYHYNLAAALKESGFDVVSTANNHTLDRFGVGVDRTIDNLNRADMRFTGTRHRESADDHAWEVIVRKNSFRVAWIACTAMTNGIDDPHKQVLYCYKRKDRRIIVNTVRRLRHKVDAIFITPHWGQEYQHTPTPNQTAFAKQMLNAGALAIIGGHPHVLQPLQKYRTKDGRDTLIAYSLGNFVSYQGTPKNRSTVVLLIGLTKTRRGTMINGVRYVPAYMRNRNGLDNIHLSVLKNKDKQSVGYKIISSILPLGNMVTSLEQVQGRLGSTEVCRHRG